MNSQIERITTPGGEVVLATKGDHIAYNEFGFAVARRAGDYVYVSGLVIGMPADQPVTVETFKTQLRAGFGRLEARLIPYAATLADVVMINSYHNWDAAPFSGDRLAQFQAVGEVKREFMPKPHPAWTAVGTSGLLGPHSDGGVVEIQMIAYAPPRPQPGG
jgi:enamine deaminase RidA (YjgF/YER057c/UK114 family)